MPNPYLQVARTYLERPVLSFQRPLSIFYFFACLIAFIGFIANHKLVSSQLFLFIILFFYWAIHVKEQFADSRASLTPGFRNIHGIVAVMAGIVIVILLPGVTALLIGWQPLGLVSITMVLFGIKLWAILRLGYIFISLIWIGWISTSFEPIQNSILQIVSGNKPVQAFTFLVVGAALSITGIIRLFLINEDNLEYHLDFTPHPYGRSKLSDQWQKLEKSYSQRWKRWLTNRTAVRIIYHARHAADSYWSRMQRWNNYHGAVWSALFPVVFVNLFTTMINLYNGTTPLSETRIGFPTVLPLFSVYYQFILRKRRFIAQDLMMPVRRDRYLKELGSSLAFNLFIMWAVMTTVSIIWMFTLDPKPNPEFLVFAVPYSAMLQIWLFGLAVWIHSFRSDIMSFFIMLIAALFSIHSYPVFGIQMMSTWYPLILGALLACLGLLFVWLGYRRWLVADFE